MAKPTAPLLSFGASGQIGKAAVYSSWKGRSYVRRHVVPANPNTDSQKSTRQVFSFLAATWKAAPSLITDAFAAYAKGKVLTDRNAFTKFNLTALLANDDMSALVLSPGSNGGFSPPSPVVTPGDGTLTAVVTAPTNYPSTWTIAKAVGVVVPPATPSTDVSVVLTAVSDASDPYSLAFTGLTNGTVYQVVVWLVWTRPDGSLAYSPSVQTTGTPAA